MKKLHSKISLTSDLHSKVQLLTPAQQQRIKGGEDKDDDSIIVIEDPVV